MIAFLTSLHKLLETTASALKGTVSELTGGLLGMSGSRLGRLVREGSPLELLLDSTLTLVFWVLVLSPFLLVPLYYLFISVLR